jgi:DNA-binding NarL/FixJ family response regulator
MAKPKGKIRVLLADDHTVLRQGLRALLEAESDIEVVADVGNGRDAVLKARELSPDVVVMDIGMPDLNGIDATRQIIGDLFSARVLCLSVHREIQLVRAMLRAGANGYLLKTCARKELVDAVRAVASGQTYLCPPIASDVVAHDVRGTSSSGMHPGSGLTDREREVLQLIAEGHHTKEIADRLRISPKTVFAHRENLMKKLGTESVAALTRYALREGITDL